MFSCLFLNTSNLSLLPNQIAFNGEKCSYSGMCTSPGVHGPSLQSIWAEEVPGKSDYFKTSKIVIEILKLYLKTSHQWLILPKVPGEERGQTPRRSTGEKGLNRADAEKRVSSRGPQRAVSFTCLFISKAKPFKGSQRTARCAWFSAGGAGGAAATEAELTADWRNPPDALPRGLCPVSPRCHLLSTLSPVGARENAQKRKKNGALMKDSWINQSPL